MQFCQQLAVYHGACTFADQQTEGGLKCFNFSAHTAPEALSVVSEAIQEILQGLDYDLTLEESCMWNSQIFMLAWWKTVSCVPELSSMLTPEQIRTVRKLPDWNTEFFFELIRTQEWICNFMEAVMSLGNESSLLTMNLLLDHIEHVGYEVWTPSTLTCVTEFWFLTENFTLNSSQIDHSSIDAVSEKIVNHILKSMNYVSESGSAIMNDDMARVYLLFVSILTRVQCDSCTVINLKYFNDMKVAVVEYDSNILVEASCKVLKLSESTRNKICSQFESIVADSLCASFIDSASLLVTNSCIRNESATSEIVVRVYRKLLINLYDKLKKNSIQSESEGSSKSSSLVLTKLESCVESLREFELKMEAEASTVESLFEKHLNVMNSGDSAKTKDSFLWLLDNCNEEIVKDKRWLDCLSEYSPSNAKTSEIFLKLLKAACVSRNSSSKTDLKKIVLDTYRGLSHTEQNSVLKSLYCDQTSVSVADTESLFNVNMDEFNSHVRSLLNKLTNDDLDLEMMTGSVSEFLLQSPVETVLRIVDSAVNNKSHVQSIVKITSHLPCILLLKKEEEFVVYEHLEFYLYNESSTEKQSKAAIMLFTNLLIEMFHDKNQSACVNALLQICLFNHMIPVSELTCRDPASEQYRVFHRSLDLLSAISEQISLINQTWECLTPLQPVLVILWLCQLQDFCERHTLRFRSAEEHREFLSIRVKSGSIIENLMKVLKDADVPDAVLKWLDERISELHWTLRPFIQQLLTNISSHETSVIFHRLLQTDFCVSDCNEEISKQISAEDLYKLYRYAMISDDTLDCTLTRVCTDFIHQDSDWMVHCICALTKLLLRCSLAEWRRLVLVTSFLIGSDCPSEENSGFEKAWSILTDSLLLLYQVYASEENTVLAWSTLTEHYSSALKDCLTSENDVKSNSRKNLTCESYTHILGLILQLLHALPAAETRALTLLAADVMSLVQASSCEPSSQAADVTPGSCCKLIQQSLDELPQLLDISLLRAKLRVE